MKKFLNIKNFYFVIALLSIFILFSAVYIEYILTIKPCKLCIYQRYPYIVSIFICLIGTLNIKKKIGIYLLSIVFTISLLLSVYHVGIENNVFPEFSGCAAENINITDKDKLLNSLKEIVPNCKDVTFKLFGLSLATINIFVSLIIVVISLLIIKNEKN